MDDDERALTTTSAHPLADPGALRHCTRHMLNGGDLITWSKSQGLQYSEVVEWLQSDPTRMRRWSDAVIARQEWMVEQIKSDLRKIGTSDVRQLFDENGNVLPIHKWPADVAATVQQIEVVEYYEGLGKERKQVGWTKKIKMWDKVKALELLGKTLAMFVDRHDHSGQIKLEDLIVAATQGAEGDGD